MQASLLYCRMQVSTFTLLQHSATMIFVQARDAYRPVFAIWCSFVCYSFLYTHILVFISEKFPQTSWGTTWDIGWWQCGLPDCRRYNMYTDFLSLWIKKPPHIALGEGLCSIHRGLLALCGSLDVENYHDPFAKFFPSWPFQLWS